MEERTHEERDPVELGVFFSLRSFLVVVVELLLVNTVVNKSDDTTEEHSGRSHHRKLASKGTLVALELVDEKALHRVHAVGREMHGDLTNVAGRREEISDITNSTHTTLGDGAGTAQRMHNVVAAHGGVFGLRFCLQTDWTSPFFSRFDRLDVAGVLE